MTKPTQETLREAVARAICNQSGSACHGSCVTNPCRSAINLHGKDADAAIATMFERLRNLPNEMADSIAKKHFVSFEVAKLIGRDLAAAFQQENSDG